MTDRPQRFRYYTLCVGKRGILESVVQSFWFIGKIERSHFSRITVRFTGIARETWISGRRNSRSPVQSMVRLGVVLVSRTICQPCIGDPRFYHAQVRPSKIRPRIFSVWANAHRFDRASSALDFDRAHNSVEVIRAHVSVGMRPRTCQRCIETAQLVLTRRTVTITWSPRTRNHFKQLSSATHVHRLVRPNRLAVDLDKQLFQRLQFLPCPTWLGRKIPFAHEK